MSFAQNDPDGQAKAGRDPAAEPDEAQGTPASETVEVGETGSESTEPEPVEPAPTVSPPAMTPAQVAANPAAMVRVHCDARCGKEWCLYAGNDQPRRPSDDGEPGEPYADPREVVMAAAGCLTDPPTCPGATDTTAPSSRATDPSTRAAVAAVSATPDLVAARAGVGAGVLAAAVRPVRGPFGRAVIGDPSADAASTAIIAAATARTPVMLTGTEAHGITALGAPAAPPLATGQDVPHVLRVLGIDPRELETVIDHAVIPPPTYESDPDPDPALDPTPGPDPDRPENPDTDG